MFKFSGIMLIIISTSLIGFLKASTYKKRLFELNEFKKGVEMFETEVRFIKSPLCEAFYKIGNNMTGYVAELFIDFSTQYSSSNGRNVNEIWEMAVEKKRACLSIDCTDISVIKDFGICLGATDSEGQMTNILSVIDRIDYQINLADELRQKNVKLYQSLGVYSGVLISILLI